MCLKYKKPVVIAEQGCTSLGNIDNAKKMIDMASESGANYVKFQKRNPRESLRPEQWSMPHPNPEFSYGKNYLEHREALEFDLDQHKELKDYCEERKIGYSTSVWDVTSAKQIVTLKPDFIKVPSACNNNFEMLEILKNTYHGCIIISLGMTTKEEERDLIKFLGSECLEERVVLMSCTSGYPVKFEDVCLLEIKRLVNEYCDGLRSAKAFGYSNHALGIAMGPVAYALGAQYIEYHYIDDRTKKHTDASASLEPGGLRKLVRDLNATYQALRYKDKEILDIEQPQREKLKYKK